MADKYRNFADLSANERAGVDYEIVVREQTSPVIIIAPHGGGIEPRTREIAEAIANDKFSLYVFAGLKKEGNSDLHLTATNFDEPSALALVSKHQIAIAVHGLCGEGRLVEVGGANRVMANALIQKLNSLGFDARVPRKPSRAGRETSNICNRARSKGVQLEITRDLRKDFVDSGSAQLRGAIQELVALTEPC